MQMRNCLARKSVENITIGWSGRYFPSNISASDKKMSQEEGATVTDGQQSKHKSLRGAA